MNRESESSPTFLRILLVRLRFPLLFLVIGLVVLQWDWMLHVASRWFRPEKVRDAAANGPQWFCPMHPGVVRNELANCPTCGMPLSRRKSGEDPPPSAGARSRLQLTPYRVRQAGLATSEVNYRLLVREINAVGSVAYDDRRVTQVVVKIAGRVDEVFVGFKGMRVRSGDPLYKIYTPGSVPAQKEMLQLLLKYEQSSGPPQAQALSALNAAKQRLRLWGITDSQIAEIETTRELKSELIVPSPSAGVVIKTDIQVGQELIVGQRPYTVAEDNEVRVELEIFEPDLGLLEPNGEVELQCDAHGGKRFFGAILYVEPELDPATRTAKVSLNVDNRDGRLKPGMYVTANLWVPLGQRELLLEAPAPNGGGANAAPRKIYVCEMHREQVHEKPGKCEKCGAMELSELTIPSGTKLVFTCPDHPGCSSEHPGICPKDGKALQFQVVSETARLVTEWMCPIHPAHTAHEKATCPESGRDFKLFRREDLLAVPVSAVIDTGQRKIVFVDRGDGNFESVEVTVGPRAGEYFPVQAGLKPGDRVVTAGAFLLDAEANLNPSAAAAYFGSTGHESHR